MNLKDESNKQDVGKNVLFCTERKVQQNQYLFKSVRG